MSRGSQMYEYHGDSSDDIPIPVTKRPKTRSNRTNGVDRISMLPDSLLVHILSFLPTIEDAIETDVLSKRWQYLWTSLPSIRFSYPDYDRLDEFARFVNKTLVLCNCSKLKKFMVEFGYDSSLVSNVNLWIRFATRNATEKLQLYLYSAGERLPEEDRFVLPQLFFTNSSLTELCFSYCTLVPKRVVDWKLLKKLSIGYVNLNDGVIQKILAGSPVLEILELYSFYGITRLHVSEPSLKKLILRDVWEYKEEEEIGIDNEHNYWLEISAPNLQSLEISGSLGRTNCRLADVSSLVDATLNCNFKSFDDDDDDDNSHHDYEWYQNSLRGLLASLVHVKNLTLGSWALGYFRDNLTDHVSAELYCISQKTAFEFLMMHLKIVKLAGLRWYYRDFPFSFVQFLLKNAMVLQKMVIKVDWILQEERFQAAQRFLSFPRSSPDAVIMFH